MDEKINLTDKNISIKTTNGTVVNVTCSYAEDNTLEALFLSYLDQAKCRRFKRFFEKKLQWLRAIYRFQSEPYLDRNMLEILVHSIYLYPDNRMEINLNFKDEYAEMMKEEA